MDKKSDLSTAGQVIQALGIVAGISGAAAAIFLVPISGMLPGALVGMAGGVVGALVGRLLAVTLTKKQE